MRDVALPQARWFPERVQRWLAAFLRVPPLEPWRIVAAFGLAMGVDGAQLALGPLGWTFADEVLDVVAMLGISRLLGFHPLLLPTFLIEVLPVIDVLPTWTGCVGLVVSRRRREPRIA